MPGLRLLDSPQRLARGKRISIRARKVRTSYKPLYTPPPMPVDGLNQTEARLYHTLVALQVSFRTQVNYFGGSVLGGARADFVLPDHGLVLLPDGPFHTTTYGRSRDILSDLTYKANGLTPIHFPWDVTLLPDLTAYVQQLIGRPA